MSAVVFHLGDCRHIIKPMKPSQEIDASLYITATNIICTGWPCTGQGFNMHKVMDTVSTWRMLSCPTGAMQPAMEAFVEH
jgi:hypothetical protein